MADEHGRDGRLQAAARLAVFAAAAFVWLWRGIDSSRTWYGAGLTAMPAFSPDLMFLRGHLTVVGGPLRYVTDWLSQWFFRPPWGAGILTALALGVAVAADRVAVCLAGRRLHGYRYAPALLFLVLDGHYLHLLDWQLAWVVTLAATEVLLRRPEARPAARLALLLPALTVLYYLVGSAVMVAVPLLVLGETRQRGTRQRGTPAVAVAIVLWSALLPWLCTRCGFDQPWTDAYKALLGPLVRNDEYGMAYAAAVGMVAFALLVGGLALKAAGSPEPRREPRPLYAWAAVAGACAVMIVAGRDRVEGLRLEMASHASRGEWNAVLSAADRMDPKDITQFDGYNILLALAHNGQAGESLFHYGLQEFNLLRDDPRLGDANKLLQLRTEYGLQLHNLELELGFVNEAEHATHETLETQGTYAALLVPMARIQVMHGQVEAAKVFLRLAAAQPGDPAHARPLLRELRDDPTLSGDAQQSDLVRWRLSADIYDSPSTTARMEQVVKEHPDHRLAQEYLMIWYLLGNQLDRLVASIPTFNAFGREALPRHYEEAVLCWELINGERANLGPWHIRPETREQFEQFVHALGCGSDEAGRILRVAGRPPRFAFKVFKGPWCDTYYFYRLFGTSGATP
jgi:hypothetical protein